MFAPKSVLITGTNRGLGLALVRQLLELPSPPNHIFACCRTPENAEDLNCIANENPQVVVLKLELTDTSSIEGCANTVEKIVGDSGLNVLINNGAIMKEPLTDRMKDTTEEMLNRTLGVNVVGTAMVTKYFLPMVRTAARGLKEYDSSKASIFNISSEWSSVSTLAHREGHYNYPYSMSKASVNMMTRLLAMEFKENNEKILCMCIEPGWLMTEIGGFIGPTPPEESAKALLKVFATRTEAHHGGFYTHEGKDFPF
ncbi:C-signal-like [Ptychodera flava]|uniref:C-signal-like n=1 Tax=Ptychodera flava TaxID=63121 RepID=UPI00396A8D94